MRCASCGSENEPGGRFCEDCGAPLTTACPSCRESVKPGARFCRNCGTPLQPDAPAVTARSAGGEAAVAERRLVSVLFADLVGFTTLAEDRDPESIRELLSAYFDVARKAVERHGGTVEKFIGDAVMAVWGTPVAREDDAERAVRAALELVRDVPALAPQLRARAGVLTGEAAVTIGATNQGMVAGDLVNTAARLQGVAEPGTVLVGEPTMRAAERAVVFEEVGEHSLKGRLTPVPAWRAVRVVAQRGGQQRADALEPPFVGRDEELRLLKEQVHAPGRDERARLVSITGPGGIGKSRLVWELEKYIDGVTEPIYWHRGRSPSYGEGIAFWALGEMVRRRAGLSEDDDEITTRERIRATVEEYVSDTAERSAVEPALLTLLGIGDAGGGRDALFPAWRTFFERISERGTTALVFEDLQWADTGLLDFIDHLLDWSKSRPILVVTLARPELFDKRPDWGAGRRAFTSLALDPLSDDVVRQLLDGVVPGLPDSAVAAIVSRAEGMPLYAVETVRALLAEGKVERHGDVYRPVGDLSSLTVPETLRSLIASRLDALDPADRALLQDASVLGQVFDLPTLAELTGEPPSSLAERLRDLARRELVELETDAQSPERGQYKFVQALIREVAYGTLARRDRRARHLAVARHYESLGDEELAGALASHYLAAHEASAEGGEADAVATQARIALRAAAERAASLGAHAQAQDHVERALGITHDPAERAELLERAALASHFAGTGDAVRYANAAVEARRAMGDITGVGRVTAVLAQVLLDLDELEAAVEVLEPVLDGERQHEPQAEAELQVALSRAYVRLGRNGEALERAERALTIAEPHGLQRVVADALNARASAISRMGRRREALALQNAAVELAAANGWADLELRLRNNLSVLLSEDDFAGATRESRKMVEISERIGSVQWYVRSVAGLAGSLFELAEDWDEAATMLDDALSRAGDNPLGILVSTYVQLRSSRGDPPTALLPALDRLSSRPHSASLAEIARSWVWQAAGDLPAAERHAQRARDLDETGDGYSMYADMMVSVLFAARDLDGLKELHEFVRARTNVGELSRAARDVIAGGIAILEGRAAEGQALIDGGIAQHRSMGVAWTAAVYQLAAVRLAPELPAARAWATEAREVFARVGASAFLLQLDEAEAAIQPATQSGQHTTASEGAATA